MHQLILDNTSWQLVALLVLLSILCVVAFRWRSCVMGADFPDLWRHWYTPVEVQKFLGGLEGKIRRLYAISELTVDVVFPVCYSGLAIILMAVLMKISACLAWQWLLYLPLLTAVADLSENVSVAFLALTFDQNDPPRKFAYVTAISSFVKWKSSYFVLAALAFLVVRLAWS